MLTWRAQAANSISDGNYVCDTSLLPVLGNVVKTPSKAINPRADARPICSTQLGVLMSRTRTLTVD